VKILPALLALVCAGLFAGCAITERDADEVGQQFSDGLQGRGQIVPYNPTSDSFGNEYN